MSTHKNGNDFIGIGINYVLLTVHPGITPGKWPTWCTITLYKTCFAQDTHV